MGVRTCPIWAVHQTLLPVQESGYTGLPMQRVWFETSFNAGSSSLASFPGCSHAPPVKDWRRKWPRNKAIRSCYNPRGAASWSTVIVISLWSLKYSTHNYIPWWKHEGPTVLYRISYSQITGSFTSLLAQTPTSVSVLPRTRAVRSVWGRPIPDPILLPLTHPTAYWIDNFRWV